MRGGGGRAPSALSRARAAARALHPRASPAHDAHLSSHAPLPRRADFYSKAKAYEQLSTFYEACAAVEIDEYRNYEKAAAALREAAKQSSRIKEEALKDARTASLTARIALVDRFVLARKLAKTDTAQMVAVCSQLLEQRDAETAIRIGDVFALLVYFHQQALDFGKAHALIEAMRARAIPVDPFVDAAAVAAIYAAAGKALPVKAPATPPPEDEVGEEIE